MQFNGRWKADTSGVIGVIRVGCESWTFLVLTWINQCCCPWVLVSGCLENVHRRSWSWGLWSWSPEKTWCRTFQEDLMRAKITWEEAEHTAMDRPLSICLAPCGLQGCKNRPTPFPGRMSCKATKPGIALSVLSCSLGFFWVCVLCC